MSAEEISIDTSSQHSGGGGGSGSVKSSIVEMQSLKAGLKHLPNWPPVNIDFQDISFSVPDLVDGNKKILRNISGRFESSKLTAILGPSGAGKSTLLNVLAGYKCAGTTGTININNKPRDMKVFQRMSRYIMQQDVYQPMLSVREAMLISADLKLGNTISRSEKFEVIDEILELLRLTNAANTMGDRLSGGERKRLSIALELVNNPPVIFLDEPTTGLDDLSCSQCISLLRRVAQGGRTVICSVHTPSAKIFEMFDHVYIVAAGQCVYQGNGGYIVPYLKSIGLTCPLTYNPSDFVIEVATGEYGNEYLDKMVRNSDNGKCLRWRPDDVETLDDEIPTIEKFEEEISPKLLKSTCSGWKQFRILHRRMTLQMWRDSSYIKLRTIMHIFLGLVIGSLFLNMGNDASKTIFNFGFCFTIIILYMYIPMMPILLEFPSQMELLKREYFNRWYQLKSYYLALIISKLPMQIILGSLYMTMVYFLTDQPREWQRMLMVYSIAILISLTSESFGMMIASRMSVLNGMFVGPVVTVPLMLLAVFGIGYGRDVVIPAYVKVLMSLSYLRYGLEGIIASIYGYNRTDMICPETEIYCQYRKAEYLMANMGFENVDYFVSLFALCGFYFLFNASAYYLIKRRLSVTGTNLVAVQYIGRFVKTHLNFTAYKC